MKARAGGHGRSGACQWQGRKWVLQDSEEGRQCRHARHGWPNGCGNCSAARRAVERAQHHPAASPLSSAGLATSIAPCDKSTSACPSPPSTWQAALLPGVLHRAHCAVPGGTAVPPVWQGPAGALRCSVAARGTCRACLTPGQRLAAGAPHGCAPAHVLAAGRAPTWPGGARPNCAPHLPSPGPHPPSPHRSPTSRPSASP